MSADSSVFAALNASAGLVSLVQTRIYADSAAQSVPLPIIVLERRATAPIATIHDELPVASKATIAISAWATTRRAAEQIGDATLIAMRSVGLCINRFSHYDNDTTAHADVLEFEVWEV